MSDHKHTSADAGAPGRAPAAKPNFAFTLHKDAQVGNIIAVSSGKGGVGKSTVTAILAVMLSRRGLRVGILDADLTGPSIPQAFGVHEQANGEDATIYPVLTRTGIQLISMNVLLEDPSQPVVWRGPVIGSVIRQFYSQVVWDELDVLLIDMPPGTADVPLTIFQSLPVDGLVVVSTPQDLVAMIVEKASRMAKMMHVPLLGLIENMSYYKCPHCDEKAYPFGRGKSARAAESLDIPLLAEMPLDSSYAELVDAGEIESLPGMQLNNAVEAILAVVSAKGTGPEEGSTP